MVDTLDPPSSRPASSERGIVQALFWLQMILLSVVVPIVVYDVLVGRGVGPVPALLASSIGPILDVVITLIRSRRVDEFAVMVLVFLAIGIVTSLIFDDPRLLLLKESAITLLFGLIALGSLVIGPRPLMFYFGRRFATGGDPARVEWWDGLWRFEGFRRTQRVITTVWGVVLVVEAVARGVLTYVLPIGPMVVVNNVVPFVVIAALATWTALYAKRAQRRAASLHA